MARSDDEIKDSEFGPSITSILQAKEVIEQHGHLTPVSILCTSSKAAIGTSRLSTLATLTASGVVQVQTSKAINLIAERQLFFKCEQFQKGGAFKFRGASNAVFSLTPEQARNGVVTHSSGNHAAALALAAKLRNIPAYIVVPSDIPKCKLEAVRTYEGEVVLCEPTIDAREATCAEIRERTGAHFVHPYNDPYVISGQGTVGLELLEQVPSLDAIIVPVSGGGLISGVAIAAKAINPDIVILAAEPTGSNDAADCAAAKTAGKIVPLPKPKTIADGLQARLGSKTWPQIRDLVADVIPVSDEDILSAMKLLFERMKLVVEPSGATALAAALSPEFKGHKSWTQLTKVGIVLSGGNVDFAAKGFWDVWKL